MKLADIRQEYMRAGLDESDADHDPFRQFQHWFKDALDSGVALPNAMTLATATRAGKPSARQVLLKGLENGAFVFFTNYDSRKSRELDENPQASLLFCWEDLERQIRIEGRIERVPAAESDAYFASRPLGSRHSAWASPQSAMVASRTWLEERLVDAQRRHGDNPPRPPHWGGFRVVPDWLEFWQGRANRLHDRLAYVRAGAAWRIERLAP